MRPVATGRSPPVAHTAVPPARHHAPSRPHAASASCPSLQQAGPRSLAEESDGSSGSKAFSEGAHAGWAGGGWAAARRGRAARPSEAGQKAVGPDHRRKWLCGATGSYKLGLLVIVLAAWLLCHSRRPSRSRAIVLADLQTTVHGRRWGCRLPATQAIAQLGIGTGKVSACSAPASPVPNRGSATQLPRCLTMGRPLFA